MNRDGGPVSEPSDPYLEALASAQPTPGGGSAAATVAATGAALIAMVARITASNERFAERRADAEAIVAEADAVRSVLLDARTDDERAYRAVVAALALPRTTDRERTTRTAVLQSALAGAAAEPLRIARLATEVLGLAGNALALGNGNLATDLGCAAEFAEAAVAAAALNVRVNHAYLKDAALRSDQAAGLAALEVEAARRAAHVRKAVAQTLPR